MNSLKKVFFILLLAFIALASMLDLVSDYSQDSSWWHLVIEGCVILFSLAGITYLLYEIWQRKKENQVLRTQLKQVNVKLTVTEEKLKEVGKQYHQVIQEQYTQWQLTSSEKEVAMFLIKGLSFKEIADARDTQEKTVRQQASSIYKKSNLNSRHEFAAYFFEDFL